jgi:tRNA threonylcarbamoyl adenosine modification protein YeaZ
MNLRPLVLAIETASRIGSVALAFADDILAETSFSAPTRHSAEIFPAVSEILRRFGLRSDNIDHVYISAGPGSFTGLRIAVTIAKTMHLAAAVKIIAVDTLDVIAANTDDYIKKKIAQIPRLNASNSDSQQDKSRENTEKQLPERIAAVLDAKRGRFYIAAYQLSRIAGTNTDNPITWKKILPDSLMTSSQFLDRCARRPIWLLGDGLLYHKDIFRAEMVRFLDDKYWSPRASKVLLLGWKKALTENFENPLTLTPNYLLRPDIRIKTR